MTEHRFRLGGSDWWMWRDGLLRSTGFPVSGLVRLSDGDLAAHADRYLAGGTGARQLVAAFRHAMDRLSAEVADIARDASLREALIWERLGGTDRSPEFLIGQWQRYCAVNDPIGFFGPICWISVDPDQMTTVTVGDELLAQRRVFLEPWALAAYGSRLAADPEVRRWLAPTARPHQTLVESVVLSPDRPPVRVTGQEAAAIALCDGRRPAAVVAGELASAGVVAHGDAAYELLASLVERRLLDWDANLPVAPHTEEVLAGRIAAIDDPRPRRRAATGLERLRSACAAVAKAAGDPDALEGALDALDQTFTETARRRPRRAGWGYPGRAVCYEDTVRDATVVVGGDFIESITPALLVLLRTARWLTAELARRFEAELDRLVAEATAAGGPVRLAAIWDRTVDLLFAKGRGALYADVLEDFARRWRALLTMDTAKDESVREKSFASAQLDEPARRLFAAAGPGWSMARVHSPDVLVCARSDADIASARVTAVLGELHIGYATCSRRVFAWPLPDPLRLPALSIRDYGRPRLIPLVPTTWARYAGRVLQFDDAPTDRYIGFSRAAGVPRDRVVATTGVIVESDGTRLLGRLADGSTTPLIEFFGALLSMCATNGLRDVVWGGHTPRITIDRLVVWRETWRLTPEDVDCLDRSRRENPLQGYLSGRRLAGRLGLPDRCFVRLSTGRKPFYVDFTNPLSVAALGSAVARGRGQDAGVEVTVTEMLPDVQHAWLSDANDNRYFAEFRFQVTDTAEVGL